jgi:hypothetical protein
MNDTTNTNFPFDYLTFEENQRKFPVEELLKYAGLTYAWSADGTRILASGKDELEVAERLKEMGIDISQVVFANMPDCDTILPSLLDPTDDWTIGVLL